MKASTLETFRKWADYLDEQVVEREDINRLILLALFSRQHVLLLGPPGTGKTKLAQLATAAVSGKLFTTLLTKFSTPEDVIGPLSLSALEEERYAREMAGYLPTADIAFVDEIYKANASILNALLSVLNERKLYMGAETIDVPLVSMIAASNEVPDEDDGLGALDDRLILRARVDKLSPNGLTTLLTKRDNAGVKPEMIDRESRKAIEVAAQSVELAGEVLEAVVKSRELAVSEGLNVSDRRIVQLTSVMKTMAAIDGKTRVELGHLGVLRFGLWSNPNEITKAEGVLRELIGHVVDKTKAVELMKEAKGKLTETENYSSGYYGRDEEGKAALAKEAVHKAVAALRCAEELQEKLRKVTVTSSGLWGSFWPRDLTDSNIGDAVDSICQHPVILNLKTEFPSLAKTWQERRVG